MGFIYYCDVHRHLVCVPYSIENLHLMAQDLGIKRCWFHGSSRFPHYDVPKRRVKELAERCTVVSSRDILSIVKGTYGQAPEAPDDTQKTHGSPDGGA